MNQCIPLFLTAILLTLFVSGLSAQCPDYSEPGPFAYATRTVTVVPDSGVAMPGSIIYYPIEGDSFARSAVPCPIIVFGHGLLVGPDMNITFGRHLATWGYVVVMMTYPDPVVPNLHTHRLYSRYFPATARWVSALDTVPTDIFYHKLDRWNWGFTGYSAGGMLAYLAADVFGLRDTLRAVVTLVAPVSDPPADPARISQPKLILAGGVDDVVPWQISRATYWLNAPEPGVFAVIHGAGHCCFMDTESTACALAATHCTIPLTQQLAIGRKHMTATFERYLHNDISACAMAFSMGDSIRFSPAMDSVEIRAISVAVEQRARTAGRIDIAPNPFSTSCRIVLPDEARAKLYSIFGEPAGELGPGETMWVPPSGQSGFYLLEVGFKDGSTLRKTLFKLP